MNSFELWKNEDMGMPEAVINTDSYTDALEKVLHNLGYYIIKQKKHKISGTSDGRSILDPGYAGQRAPLEPFGSIPRPAYHRE